MYISYSITAIRFKICLRISGIWRPNSSGSSGTGLGTAGVGGVVVGGVWFEPVAIGLRNQISQDLARLSGGLRYHARTLVGALGLRVLGTCWRSRRSGATVGEQQQVDEGGYGFC